MSVSSIFLLQDCQGCSLPSTLKRVHEKVSGVISAQLFPNAVFPIQWVTCSTALRAGSLEEYANVSCAYS